MDESFFTNRFKSMILLRRKGVMEVKVDLKTIVRLKDNKRTDFGKQKEKKRKIGSLFLARYKRHKDIKIGVSFRFLNIVGVKESKIMEYNCT